MKNGTLAAFLARTAAVVACLLVGPIIPSAAASDRVRVGALRFSSSGPLFVALNRGYFRDEGVDVDLAFFDAAPTLAVAMAAGDLAFGVSALSATFFNLAEGARFRILAGQASERKGWPGSTILVAAATHQAGRRSVRDLLDQPFGLTQVGSSSHFQLGQLAEQHGVSADKLHIRAFQTLPNLVAALRGGQVAWALISPPISTDLITSGAAVEIGRFSDFQDYQFGVAFTRQIIVETQPELVRRFLQAYRRGLRDYAALNAPPSSGILELERRDVAEIVAGYVYPASDPETRFRNVLDSALYVDPTGSVDVADVGRQLRWYVEHKLAKPGLKTETLFGPDLLP